MEGGCGEEFVNGGRASAGWKSGRVRAARRRWNREPVTGEPLASRVLVRGSRERGVLRLHAAKEVAGVRLRADER